MLLLPTFLCAKEWSLYCVGRKRCNTLFAGRTRKCSTYNNLAKCNWDCYFELSEHSKHPEHPKQSKCCLFFFTNNNYSFNNLKHISKPGKSNEQTKRSMQQIQKLDMYWMLPQLLFRQRRSMQTDQHPLQTVQLRPQKMRSLLPRIQAECQFQLHCSSSAIQRPTLQSSITRDMRIVLQPVPSLQWSV